MTRKIKYYQDDNLRLSNEVVKLSTKLENTKRQLEHFENNKSILMSQLENLNKTISENNVIGNPFKETVSKVKVEDSSKVDKKISNTKHEEQNKFQTVIQPAKILNAEELNFQTKKIFEK